MAEPVTAAHAGDRAASESVAAPPRRTASQAVLTGIGIIVVGLLGAGVYALYNPPADERLVALQQDVAALKQQVAALPRTDLAPLDARVAALSQSLDSLKTVAAKATGATQAASEAKAAVAPLDDRIAALDKTVAGLSDKVAALPRVDLAPLDDKLAALDKRVMPLETYFNAPKTGAQVTEARQNGSAAETRAAPLAILADGALAAIAAGRPFEPEVAALHRLGVDDATLKPLAAVAGTGAATQADLLSGFKTVQDQVVVAAAPVSTGTMLDRMMANAQSLVKVSRSGAAPGEDAGALASRIEASLQRGDLAAASADWAALPAASKARSTDWAAKLDARLAAEAAARSIETGAVAALAAQP